MAAKKTQSRKSTRSVDSSSGESAKQADGGTTPNKLNSQKKGSLKQTSILVLSCITAVIVLALLTYNPDDPGLFQYDSNGVVSNKAGSFGAYIASVLFGFFGNVAYLVPLAFLVPVFLMFRSDRKASGGINTGITVFGVFLALLAGCGLATLLWPDSTLIYKAGGLLGLMVSKIVVHMLGMLGATLLLFTLFMAGVTLFADIHWLKLIDKIGDTILGVVELFAGSNNSPKTANAGIDAGQMSFSDDDYETKQQAAKGSSGGMLDAVGDGLRALFVSRKSAATVASDLDEAGMQEQRPSLLRPKPKSTPDASARTRTQSSGSADVGVATARIANPSSKSADPVFDDEIGQSIVPLGSSSRQEPVLGFPEHMMPDNDALADSADVTPVRKNRKATSLNPLSKLRQVAKSTKSRQSAAKKQAGEVSAAQTSTPHFEAEHLVADEQPEHNQNASTADSTVPHITVQGPRHTPPRQIPVGKAANKTASGKRSASTTAIALDKAITMPPISLLNPPPATQGQHSKELLEQHAHNIVITLEHYGVRGVEIDCYYPGPIITRYELLLPPGTKVSKISGLSQDIARSMCVSSIRIVEVIPGKTTIGVEVPNETRDLVAISDVLDSSKYRDAKSPLTMVLGKTIAGKPAVADLARMPHLLIAGTTGSGKSVGVNAMLMSLLYKATPEDVRLILIDPKMLELSIYEGIPHLLTSVVTDMKDAANSLRWAVGEMERRYALMSHLKVRNIGGYNAKVKEAIARGEPMIDPTFDPTKHVDVRPKTLEPLPYIVIVIDEFADMIMVVGKKVEELIARLAQKARAAGVHLILATQRPSVDVITGLIKANIPSRIAFQVSTKIDSRTILDQGGAESLLGHGDMLYLPPGTGLPQRIHGAFVADSEVEDVVSHWKLQGEPEYLDDVLTDTGSSDAIPGLEPLADSESDPLYDQAVAIVTESRRASISYVQRRLKVGYNRAASMIEDMEKAGVVSSVQSNGTREVLAPEPPKP